MGTSSVKSGIYKGEGLDLGAGPPRIKLCRWGPRVCHVIQQSKQECKKLLISPFLQALVVQTLDSAIHWINHYPAVKYYEKQMRHLLDRDLSTW